MSSPANQQSSSCLHCGNTLSGSIYPISGCLVHDGKQTTVSAVLKEIFPEQKYSDAENQNFCKRCYKKLMSALGAMSSAVSRVTEFLSDSKDDSTRESVAGNIPTYLNWKMFSSGIQNSLSKQGVDWFSMIKERSAEDLLCYGSETGIKFIQQEKDTLHKFHCVASDSTHCDELSENSTESSGAGFKLVFSTETPNSGRIRKATNVSEEARKSNNSSVQKETSEISLTKSVDKKRTISTPKRPALKFESESKRNEAKFTERSIFNNKGKKSILNFKNNTEAADKEMPVLTSSMNNEPMDFTDNWLCNMCDRTFKRKKHALLHVIVAHKISKEDSEKVVKDRSLPKLAREEKKRKQPSSDLHHNSVKKLSDTEEDVAKKMKLNSSERGKDWECLACHKMFVWKRSLLIHLRIDHKFKLQEVQEHVHHNASIGTANTNVGEKKQTYMCAVHPWQKYENKEDCLKHIQKKHKCSMAKALKKILKVDTTYEKATIKNNRSNKEDHEEETDSPAELLPIMDCVSLSSVMSKENESSNDMPELEAVNRETGVPLPNKKVVMQDTEAKASSGTSDMEKPYECSICNHRSEALKAAKNHLKSNHNINHTVSKKFINVVKEDEEFEEADKVTGLTSTSTSSIPVTSDSVDTSCGNLNWACVMCGLKFSSRSTVLQHLTVQHEVLDENLHEMVVHKGSLSEEEWLGIKDPVNKQKLDENVQNRNVCRFKCGLCVQLFKRRSAITRHLTDVHFLSNKDHEFYIQRNEEFKKQWRCTLCGRAYFSSFDVRRHVSQGHGVAWEQTREHVIFVEDFALFPGDNCNADGRNLMYSSEFQNKPYMCVKCRKCFITKRSLLKHVAEIHRCTLTAENFEEYVKDKRKVPYPILDYLDCTEIQNSDKIRTTELVNYIIQQTKVDRQGTEQGLDEEVQNKVKYLEINGRGPFDEKDWSQVCGTSGECELHGQSIYRSRSAVTKKKFFCTICKLRYYRFKDAHRHINKKHSIAFEESCNHVGEDTGVVDVSEEVNSGRNSKRRVISKNRKYLFHCVKCLRGSWYFSTLKKHAKQAHKMKEEDVYKFICRTSNVDPLKLSYEDKMNFVCILCGMTFKNRLDAQAHGPSLHSVYSSEDQKKIVFQKTGEDLLYVVHTSKTTGNTKVFWTRMSDILQDAAIIRDEEQDCEKTESLEDTVLCSGSLDMGNEDPPSPGSEQDEKQVKNSQTLKKLARDKHKEIENFMCVMLDHCSQVGLTASVDKEYTLQYNFEDFYTVFTVQGNSDLIIKSDPVMNRLWCEFCMKSFKDDLSMRSHIGKCQSKLATKWECLNCKAEFLDILTTVDHISKTYGLQSESDILTYIRSKELMEIPDNGTFLMIDGRSDEEANLLYQTLKAKESQTNASDIEISEDFASKQAMEFPAETHSPVPTGVKEYKPCFICGHRNKHRVELLKHMKDIHKISGQNKLSDCLECMIHFKSREDLSDHLVSVHKVKIAHPTLYSRPCLVCNEVFRNNVSLSQHLKQYNGCFSCYLCGCNFDTYGKLCKHVKREHMSATNKSVKCQICPSLLQPCNLEDHMVGHYDRAFGPWNCVVCSKVFVVRKHLREHLKGQHKVFMCFKCGRQFDCLHIFRKHESVHRMSCKSKHILDEYKCVACKEIFPSRGMLQIHRKNNCKRFVCHLCGRKMCSTSSLASHIRNHQLGKVARTKKQRTCESCNKTLSSHAMWKRHQVVHSKQKPYQCGICESKFSFINALRYHLQKRHPEYKPYKCPICDQAFLTTHIKNYHMKMNHKDYVDPMRPIKCEHCECRFKAPVGLQIHMKNKHQDKLLHRQRYFECENCPRIYKNRKNFQKHSKECSMSINTKLYNTIKVNVSTLSQATSMKTMVIEPTAQSSSNRDACEYIVSSIPDKAVITEATDLPHIIGEETITYITAEGEEFPVLESSTAIEMEAPEGSQLVSIADNTITLPGGRQIRFQNDETQYMEIPSDMLIETTDGYVIVVSEGNG